MAVVGNQLSLVTFGHTFVESTLFDCSKPVLCIPFESWIKINEFLYWFLGTETLDDLAFVALAVERLMPTIRDLSHSSIINEASKPGQRIFNVVKIEEFMAVRIKHLRLPITKVFGAVCI